MTNPIVILSLHHVRPGADRLSVPPGLLETLLQTVQKRYTFISYETFKGYVSGEVPVAPNRVLLSFDDGYLDNFLYAFPVLARMAVPAVMFLITGLVADAQTCRSQMADIGHKALWQTPDAKGFVNTAEIDYMAQSRLMAFDSHSVSHMTFRGKTADEMEREFADSHAFIRDRAYGQPPFGFCWPKGAYDAPALAAIRESPYAFGFSTQDGGWLPGDDPFTIRRVDCSSFSGDPKDYLFRVRRKLFLYATPVLGRMYTGFRTFRGRMGGYVKRTRPWK